MRIPWRKVAVVTLAGAAALGLAGWVITHPVVRDPYKFLGGRLAGEVGVVGPGSWSAKEIRLYTWRQPWGEVAAVARKELTALGMNELPRKKGDLPGANWMGEIIDGGPCGIGSDKSVYILPGRAKRMTEFGEFTDSASDWVTVFVSSDLDESWVNVIRYTFFSIPEK
jgi:hypothetical protein